MALTRRKKRRLIALGCALFACPLLILVLGEGYVRLRHPAYADLWGAIRSHPTWVRELRPGASGRMRALTKEYDHRYTINAQGLRGVSDLGAKRAGTRRVLAVGDSHTFGLGVEDEEVWVQSLGGEGVEALNAGWASGYAPDTACLFLEARLDELQPDLVIQQLTPDNDLRDLAWRSQWELDGDERLVAVKHRYNAVPDAVQALAFPRFLMLQVLPSWRAAPASEASAEPSEPVLTPEEELGLKRMRTVLKRTQANLARRGIEFVALVFPTPVNDPVAHGVQRVAHANLRRDQILALLKDLKIRAWDPSTGPELSALSEPAFYADGHMTAAGNAAMGSFVRRQLSAQR